jgi:hypothetical protein
MKVIRCNDLPKNFESGTFTVIGVILVAIGVETLLLSFTGEEATQHPDSGCLRATITW